jgi:drug/metabolite transporter (DMT)-like permease
VIEATMTKTKAYTAWYGIMPGVFVVLWSTGFIGARFGLPHAEPFTFLLLRFAILTILLGGFSLLVRAPWPSDGRQIMHTAISGLLVHCTYLGGVFFAISKGMPVAITALIVGTQPLITAALAGPFLGEKVTGRQWAGFILGMAGVALVLGPRLGTELGGVAGLAGCIFALLGITLGTLYQKRHGGQMDLRSGSTIQFAVCTVAMILLASTFESMAVNWTGEFIFALLWLVVVLSVGAISLLYILIRRGVASQVASLFYLVPPVTAIIAYLVFGETLSIMAILGMAVSVFGVALVVRK